MTQEQINILLVVLPFLIPFVQFLLGKYFSRGKDRAEYSAELLEIANQATEALRKTREELLELEEVNDRTVESMRKEHDAAIYSIRTEYDARHERLKKRIAELERVQKVYAIQFDLVTHPNVEIRNISARSMDDVTTSQKMKAITAEQIAEHKENKEGN